MDALEKEAFGKGFKAVAGLDEAGRGPLAGPVVAAAVVFAPFPCIPVKDSKKLTPKKRDELFPRIYSLALGVGVGIVWPDEIDRINILRATLLAMEKALTDLTRFGVTPDFLLIDGPYSIKGAAAAQRGVVGGDGLSYSIAAASIVAKVTRDRIMAAYHNVYPAYNFIGNKGYPTAEHVAALRSVGPSPIHRKSFSY